jgi:1-acyl-sn-glycerol-3-phosphate acyltransferase
LIVVRVLATASAIFAAIFATLTVGTSAVIAGMIGFSDGPRSPYHVFAPWWSRIVLALSFVRVRVHNPERAFDGHPHIFVANHLSWYDVPVLSSFLPRAKFVAKEELFKIPIFGKAMKAVGMVPIQRDKRKAAFTSYDAAAGRVKNGNSIVVFPEGTRGTDYRLRPFKKGPFVLAFAAGATIVPVLIHGAHDVLPRGSWLVRPRRVDVHLLEPVSVEGLDVTSRDAVAQKVWLRMSDALATHYGVESPAWTPASSATAAR